MSFTPNRNPSSQTNKVTTALNSYLNVMNKSGRSLSPSPGLSKSGRPSPSMRKDSITNKMSPGDRDRESFNSNYENPKSRILQPRNFNVPSTHSAIRECRFHEGKKCKYYCQDNPEVKFCSKCAINYALEGKKVLELNEMQPEKNTRVEKNPKRKLIEDFLNELLGNKEVCHDFLLRIQSRTNDISEYTAKQISKLDTFYENLHIFIDEQRKNMIASLVHYQEETSNRLSIMEQRLIQYLSEMGNINDDIESNVENIVRNMEIEPLQEILKRYRGKLGEYKEAYRVVEGSSLSLLKAKVPASTSPDSEVNREIQSWLESWIELKEGKLQIMKKMKDFNSNVSMYISFENKESFDAASNSSPSNIKPMRVKEPSTDCSKYLSLLQKVSSNQANTHDYYSEIIKKQNEFQGNGSFPLKDHFSQFIEKKLNDERDTPRGENFQKTLFSSPQFKDVEFH